jgi:glycosyltransferase involved in cell wall biosynthesis
VGEVTRSFLPLSETFTYTQIMSLRRFVPVVLTWLIEGNGNFPGVPVVEVAPAANVVQRVARYALARRDGAANAFEHRLQSAAGEHQCQILHAHFGWMGVASLHAQRHLGVPLVTTFHAQDIVTSRPDLAQRYPELFARGTLFTAVGPGMARRLAERGCPADRIRVVKLGLDLERLACHERPVDGEVVFLQVGRLVEKKGAEVSLRSFAAIHDELGQAELWLVGDGPLRGRLERLAAELGVARHVRFHGALSHSQSLSLMREAHIGLQPSLTDPGGDIEGTPTVLLEMQAVGLPVVATSHSDIPAIVADPEDLVPEADVDALAEAMLRTARQSPGERRRRIGEARRFVEAHHSLASSRAAIEAVYDEAMALIP